MIPNKDDIIEMIKMDNDPNPIEPGEQGVVEFVTPLGNSEYQIGVNWNSGRRLFLIYPLDLFKIIKKSDS